jgi:hypothetical protein
MAKRDVDVPFAGLELGPDLRCVVDVLARFPKHARDDALRDRLFVGKPPMAQAPDAVGECSFERLTM